MWTRELTHPETIVLVGNGAVENGWEPVKRAFKKIAHLEMDLWIDPSEPFSYVVYQLRLLQRQIDQKSKAQLTSFDKKLESLFHDRKGFYERLQHEISRELRESLESGEIYLRFPDQPKLDGYFDPKTTAILTTNWDTLLHRRFSEFSILSIHGTIDDPITLYFPTEIAVEDYRDSGRAVPQRLESAQAQASQLVEKARRIVIWGLSLHMYDAETCVLLAEADWLSQVKGEPKEYIVVDPCALPVRRLKLLTGREVLHLIPDGKACQRSCCLARQMGSG
jgi:hypothetical protein